ncbi:MAG: type II toxin-antitoxin system prevent-host-death family antitoxin [Alphaproteobacteria bacterium]|nr:type II toxin-antitoxin system prevent-host-death family antitoxin [Alphaproteobacteria bacterium]
MRISNIHDAKSHLSHLIKLVCEGEEVIICKAGKPMVKLIRYQQEGEKRQPGVWRGKVEISDDFDESSPEIEVLFGRENH